MGSLGLEILVSAAEAGVLLWLGFFTLIVVQQRRASVDAPLAPQDPIGRRFVLSAKWAIAGGLALWFVYTAVITASRAFGTGIDLPL